MTTLQNLDKTQWDAVVGPYGPAPELREALVALAGGDPPVRRHAFETIADCTNHQDLITPAALVAAPYLVQKKALTVI